MTDTLIRASRIQAEDETVNFLSGWIPRTDTWSRVDNYTFTISGDMTAVYRKNAKVMWDDIYGTRYGVIGSSSYSSPNTTIALITNNDYHIDVGALSNKFLSYVEAPESFPDVFNFTPTISSTTGTITSYTVNECFWSARHSIIHFWLDVTIDNNGTGATSLQSTIPIAAKTSHGFGQGVGRNVTSGNQLQVLIAVGGSAAYLLTYANAYPVTTGDVVRGYIPWEF